MKKKEGHRDEGSLGGWGEDRGPNPEGREKRCRLKKQKQLLG